MSDLLGVLSAAGISAAVLTNKPEDFSRRILSGLGALEIFVDVVGGDTLSTRKPDPGGVSHLLARAGVSRERTLLVGDSPVDRATAAQAAACRVPNKHGRSVQTR